jgi:hypothetical protein
VKHVNLILTFPDEAPDDVIREVAGVIASGIASDLQAVQNGGMLVEDVFGVGAVWEVVRVVLGYPISDGVTKLGTIGGLFAIAYILLTTSTEYMKRRGEERRADADE